MGDVFTSCNWIMRDGYVNIVLPQSLLGNVRDPQSTEDRVEAGLPHY